MIVATVVGVMPRRRTRFLPTFATSSSVDFTYSSRLAERSYSSFPASGQADALAGAFK